MLAVPLLLVAVAASPLPEPSRFEAIADGYFKAAKYDRVLDLANRFLESAAKNDPYRARYLLARARACTQLQDRDCAAAALDEATPLAEAGRDGAVLAHLHRERGFWLWRFEHDRARALREYDEAETLGAQAHEWSIVVTSLHLSANMFRDGPGADPAAALRRYEKALVIAKRERWGTAHILEHIGDTYLQMRLPDQAEAPLQEAAEEADRNDIAEVRWGARLQLAILNRERNPAAAERYFARCLDLLEEQQSGLLLEDFRPGMLAAAVMYANPYDAYIDFLLAHNRSADAFLVAERARARVFLETLSAARDSVVSRVSKGYLDAERETLTSLRRAQAALRGSALNDENRARDVAQVETAENRLAALRLRLAVEEPSVAHARYPRLLSERDVQVKLLLPDEALLSFYLGRDHSVAWLITRDNFQTFPLPPARAINEAARAAIDTFRNPLGHDSRGLDALSRVLNIERIGAAVHQRHLVIIPYGILNDVPLETLEISPAQPLIERAAVSYAPSASSLAFLRQARREPARDVELIAIANPVVSAKAVQSTRQFDLAHMNVLAPLPHTADEVHQVAALFGARAQVLEGTMATRVELQKHGLEQSRILHFATHGLIDESRPDRSGLLLTATPPRDDGLLQVRDIYGMHLNADLVTLSACETALGENLTGEGIIGLTRAFFFAGARSVVASLWDVDDASTSDLMKRFYANIRRGDPVDVALQRAKLDVIHAGGSGSAPFYWASFVVSGDAHSAIEAPERPWTDGLIVATIAIAIIAIALRMRRAATS